MYDLDFYNSMKISSGLRDGIGNRIANGNYSDAILSAFKFLTGNIREFSGAEGDGAKLMGLAFGGSTPLIRLNSMQTVSEKDEQAGYEQLFRGVYTAIRNPRAHDDVNDSIDFCIKTIIIIDMLNDKLSNRVINYDIIPVLSKIKDSNFV